MTLLNARQNTLYTVIGIVGDNPMRRRLLDMGFTPKTDIYVAGVAPFGGTILVAIRGTLIALREDAASLINIERTDNKAGDTHMRQGTERDKEAFNG